MLEDHAASGLHSRGLAPGDRDRDRVNCSGDRIEQAPQHDAVAILRVVRLVRGRLPRSDTLLPAVRRGVVIALRAWRTASVMLSWVDSDTAQHAWLPPDLQRRCMHASGSARALQCECRSAFGPLDTRRAPTGCRHRKGARWQCRPRFIASCGDSRTRRDRSRPPLLTAASEPAPSTTARMRAMCDGASGSARLPTCHAAQSYAGYTVAW